jgi:hypothetical protein
MYLVRLHTEVFSNVVSTNYLEQLAAADEHEVVQEVQVHCGSHFNILFIHLWCYDR